ncbi:aminoacyl-tRNA deacylase [Paenibacillus glufosinatiresistens]|uniref:aminoacyl-tRNA deacylase n=1 Tax=Paenibacillus glufosinatiresistens TaxID=3070657 RepID=UPI00286DCF60|nr:YbaK/EbsC family protein [Paenibacillus sp. YX.27]
MSDDKDSRLDRLRAKLDAQGADYAIIRHEKPIRSAREGAAFFGIEPGQTAPTLIGVSSEGYFALIVPGDCGPIDWDLLKPVLGAETVQMASPAEAETATGSRVGDISLIQAGLPVVLHRGLFRYEAVYGGTGVSGSTLRIRPEDLERAVKVAGYLE